MSYNENNSDRRRSLLHQLKCLIASMEEKKPREWDNGNQISFQPVCFYTPPDKNVATCVPLKCVKSFELRSSFFHKCECIRRNGLQDRCLRSICMGRPECMTKLYPVCCPGQQALVKFTDFGCEDTLLKKIFQADSARTKALEDYCRMKINCHPALPPNCPPPPKTELPSITCFEPCPPKPQCPPPRPPCPPSLPCPPSPPCSPSPPCPKVVTCYEPCPPSPPCSKVVTCYEPCPPSPPCSPCPKTVTQICYLPFPPICSSLPPKTKKQNKQCPPGIPKPYSSCPPIYPSCFQFTCPSKPQKAEIKSDTCKQTPSCSPPQYLPSCPQMFLMFAAPPNSMCPPSTLPICIQ